MKSLWQRILNSDDDQQHQRKDGDYAVLFVCMGNICRSPTAEAVFRQKAANTSHPLFIDSAGTIGHHAGQRPDPRSVAAGEKRGYDFGSIRSRKLTAEDFHEFDLILAMDKDNLRNILRVQPEGSRAEVKLMLDYAIQFDVDEVPDPYYGGSRGFDYVLDLVEDASDGILQHLARAC